MFLTRILWIMLIAKGINANCQGLQASLSFILEYAVWRGWHQAALYTMPQQKDCRHDTIKLAKCFTINGIGVAEPKMVGQRIINQIGLVIFAPKFSNPNNEEYFSNTLKELYNFKMNTYSYDWLIPLQSLEDVHNLTNLLNENPIRFDQNLIVSYPMGSYNNIIGKDNFVYKIKSQNNVEDSNNCKGLRNGRQFTRNKINNKTCKRLKNIIKNNYYMKNEVKYSLSRSGLIFNNTRKFNMVNFKKNKNMFIKEENCLGIIGVFQYFKVRTNSTLYGKFLGTWSSNKSMSFLESPYPVEARNFLGEELIVGRSNSSGDGVTELDDIESTAPELLEDVLEFITLQLNATATIRYFNKLGFRTFEGVWTGLLGELVENKVDIALEPVPAYLARYRDMNFIFPIAKTMCNIYIRHQETLTARDIFISPFSSNLLMSMIAMAMVIAIIALIINRLMFKNTRNPGSLGISEALLWTIGILCHQGASSTTMSAAARVLLIVSLLFAIITYNSYAAFITSVLSVRVTSVDTVEAVLNAPNIKIGYIKNSADQMYLMSSKDTQLNSFYIRGYSAAENLVTSVEEGLIRAANHDYAFFAGQRAARTKLRTFSRAKGRCSLHEVPVPSTKAYLAFPIPHNSPYAKLILLSLISLKSGGSLPLLVDALLPNMPECSPPSGFESARAADVRSAFLLLSLGIILAMVLGTGEYVWTKRIRLQNYIQKHCNNIFCHS